MRVFTFYTSTGMRDAERVQSQDALLSPVHKFLPFQIQRDHLAGTYVTEINMYDCDGNLYATEILDAMHGAEDLITDWENGPNPAFSFNTFNDGGGTRRLQGLSVGTVSRTGNGDSRNVGRNVGAVRSIPDTADGPSVSLWR